jgi:hypothetical protein
LNVEETHVRRISGQRGHSLLGLCGTAGDFHSPDLLKQPAQPFEGERLIVD